MFSSPGHKPAHDEILEIRVVLNGVELVAPL
jgi:hypothetical protein